MSRIVLPNPHAAQERVLSEKKRFNVVACGRRWGKTKMCSSLALQAAITGVPVGWFAPSYKLLADAMNEIGGRIRGCGEHAKFNGQERKVTFSNGGSIEFWSTQPEKAGDDESDVARGRKYARIIYDEAAHARRLKADWTRAIRATLADYQGDAWFPSTPRGQNFFYELFLRGQNGEPDWASWQMPTSANPHIAQEEIESARRELPRDAFEQEYLAQFLANAANPFGIDAIRACIIEQLAPGPVHVWGVDLAKSHDWTVAIGLNGDGHVCAFQRWQSDWRNTRARLTAMVKGTPALVDSTGVGDPIVEDAQAVCPNVEGYHFTRTSKQQLMEGLAAAIHQQRVAYPKGVIVSELETFEYEYTPTGVRYTAPEGLHDDCVCALALAVRCMQTRPQPVRIWGAGEGESIVDTFADDYDEMEDERLWQRA